MSHSPSTAATATGLSRRGLLAGVVGSAAVPLVGTGGFAPATAAARAGLPTVTPVWSEAVRRSYGVCAHPTYMTATYQHADTWLQLLKDSGAAFFRGRYSPSAPNTAKVVSFCRSNGIKWLMTVIPEDMSLPEAEVRRRLAHIRDHAADVCIAVEGVNEPNHLRGGGSLPNWAPRAVRLQKVLWDFVKATPSMSHVKVISPSLWVGGGVPVEPDFKALAAAGVTRYMDYAGMHSYPGGGKPDNMLDKRLDWVRDYWGNGIPFWGTETGYNNALKATGGFQPVPEDVSATYGPRSILTYFKHGAKSTRFELLGDPNAALNDVQAHYGLVRTPTVNPSTWTLKPEFDAIRTFQQRLFDPVRSYTPVPVRLQVTAPADVKWTVVQKSDGSNRVLAYRDVSVYDTRSGTRLNPGAVRVTVTDVRGTRVVEVGPAVSAISVRT